MDFQEDVLCQGAAQMFFRLKLLQKVGVSVSAKPCQVFKVLQNAVDTSANFVHSKKKQ